MSTFDTKFPHRVNTDCDNKFFNLIDTVNPSLERAAALADVLEVAFDAVTDLSSFEVNTLWRAAQAIHLEVKDAQTLLNAFIDAKKTSKQEVQS